MLGTWGCGSVVRCLPLTIRLKVWPHITDVTPDTANVILGVPLVTRALAHHNQITSTKTQMCNTGTFYNQIFKSHKCATPRHHSNNNNNKQNGRWSFFFKSQTEFSLDFFICWDLLLLVIDNLISYVTKFISTILQFVFYLIFFFYHFLSWIFLF